MLLISHQIQSTIFFLKRLSFDSDVDGWPGLTHDFLHFGLTEYTILMANNDFSKDRLFMQLIVKRKNCCHYLIFVGFSKFMRNPFPFFGYFLSYIGIWKWFAELFPTALQGIFTFVPNSQWVVIPNQSCRTFEAIQCLVCQQIEINTFKLPKPKCAHVILYYTFPQEVTNRFACSCSIFFQLEFIKNTVCTLSIPFSLYRTEYLKKYIQPAATLNVIFNSYMSTPHNSKKVGKSIDFKINFIRKFG